MILRFYFEQKFYFLIKKSLNYLFKEEYLPGHSLTSNWKLSSLICTTYLVKINCSDFFALTSHFNDTEVSLTGKTFVIIGLSFLFCYRIVFFLNKKTCLIAILNYLAVKQRSSSSSNQAKTQIGKSYSFYCDWSFFLLYWNIEDSDNILKHLYL